MGCSNAGHKNFLLFCNVGLLITGLAILVLGVQLRGTLILLSLTEIPMLMKVTKAVIAAGFVITVTGGTGFCGACYEIIWLICVHLGGLCVIVVMEMALGVTLMVVKNTIEEIMKSEDCGSFCRRSLKSVILDLAMPSAGLLMTIIVVEGLMVYSAVKLFFYFRDRPKDLAPGPTVVVQNVQMQNVGPAQPLPQYAPQEMTQQPHFGHATTPSRQPPYLEPQPQAMNPHPPPYAEVGPQGSANLPEGSKMDIAASSTPRHPV